MFKAPEKNNQALSVFSGLWSQEKRLTLDWVFFCFVFNFSNIDSAIPEKRVEERLIC